MTALRIFFTINSDPDWTKEETDALFELCYELDMKWFAIADRYKEYLRIKLIRGLESVNKNKSVEGYMSVDTVSDKFIHDIKDRSVDDVKDRYYKVMWFLKNIRKSNTTSE